ncbi:2OG-Fe(II) oxygenase [Streptomyces scopuliridis]|uniref:2OG-Fe(II) oxygenase n=1 Tax=Streptomyces scopuliridis TaxID=452529 RepID=UPI003692F940
MNATTVVKTRAKTKKRTPGADAAAGAGPWAGRVETADWDTVAAELDEYGGALLPRLLTPDEAGRIRDLYERPELFRSTVDMARHRFGSGEYKYFHAPYPEPVERLKQALYPRLLPIARTWWERLGRTAPWPDTLDEWLDMCHAAGQSKSTAILLRYGAGDWNALHRDLYGDLVFPLQVVINLDRPGTDHTGGEFLLVEQRPRAQSRGTATLLPQGHGYVFTTRDRPVRSVRGWSAAPVRHGVSAIRSGHRHTLALVFHDAA